MITYEAIEPPGPCVSPDGHDALEDIDFKSCVPRGIICLRCGKDWTIVTFDTEERP